MLVLIQLSRIAEMQLGLEEMMQWGLDLRFPVSDRELVVGFSFEPMD